MKFKFLILALLAFAVVSCDSFPEGVGRKLQEQPTIFPDYVGVTVPCNIAPLNFMVQGVDYVKADIAVDGQTKLIVKGRRGLVDIPLEQWQELLSESAGRSLSVTVSVWNDDNPQGVEYKPFEINVSKDEIDSWIAYRLIEPSYEGWRQMGIYQRELSTFLEKVLVDNSVNDIGCVNCHSFSNYSPDEMMFHARGQGGGTVFYKDGQISKVSFPTIGPKRQGVYPMWNPLGRFVAYSTNDTVQTFFAKGEQKIEVYDKQSDLMIYDTEKGEMLVDERFMNDSRWETFPAWSPDGEYLYFCSAKPVQMIEERKELKYDILRVKFDREKRTLAEQVDTVYHSSTDMRSASFPRISPDGRYLLYASSDCATFPVWHHASDMAMVDLQSGERVDVTALNSDKAESCHAWSSNGRWVVVGSRRLDARFTRLYFAHVSADGKCSKPFLLPQQNPQHNSWRLKSYNVPEFVRGEVTLPMDKVKELFK